MKQSQNAKYTVHQGHIINRQTRQPIPNEEPVFILRAKDTLAVATIEFYLAHLDTPVVGLEKSLADFKKFAHKSNEMREPT
jgi:hypothetical protein